ncbi:hypothetical protein FQR65_LT15172 [Abscondita terminalis]|nr:hypothetical protein FQR65_LT15172 [Abscondita terminalis]
MYKLVASPGEEIIHVLPQEFTIDNEPGIKEPVGMAGRRIEANFHIISGQVSSLVLEPLASSEAVLDEDEKNAGVVLVDIGGGTTDVAIFHEGIIRHTAVIPLVRYGSALADENKENEVICVPGIRGREAKEISVKNLAYIIQARMEEIIEHVYYEIKSSGYEDKLIGGIVVTGGGAQLKHLVQLAIEDEEASEHEDSIKRTPKTATAQGVKDIAEKQQKKEGWLKKFLTEFIKDDAGIDDDTFIGKK